MMYIYGTLTFQKRLFSRNVVKGNYFGVKEGGIQLPFPDILQILTSQESTLRLYFFMCISTYVPHV